MKGVVAELVLRNIPIHNGLEQFVFPYTAWRHSNWRPEGTQTLMLTGTSWQ